jgi:hypothetical protein
MKNPKIINLNNDTAFYPIIQATECISILKFPQLFKVKYACELPTIQYALTALQHFIQPLEWDSIYYPSINTSQF